MGAVQNQLAARFAELSKSMTPIQSNVSKAINTASHSVADAVQVVTDPQQQEAIQGF